MSNFRFLKTRGRNGNRTAAIVNGEAASTGLLSGRLRCSASSRALSLILDSKTGSTAGLNGLRGLELNQ
jgi:hypothetical protein